MTGSVTEILNAGWLGDLTTLRTLQLLCGFTNEQAAKACFVSEETYRRWLCDRKPNPMAVRLLAVIAGYIPWTGWKHWEMHTGVLFPPGYTRHGLNPGDVLALPFLYQLLAEYRTQCGATPVTQENREKPSLEELVTSCRAAAIRGNF